jgi:SAM-dependent methyltransferase
VDRELHLRDKEAQKKEELIVQGDALHLPFPDSTFTAVISNHSLEHFDHLEGALHEIGRVVRPQGALFVSVPDASTFCDRLYRWLAKGSGHVNAFTSYFGAVPEGDFSANVNVCLRCGAGNPSARLGQNLLVSRGCFRQYRCPQCGTRNPFSDDAPPGADPNTDSTERSPL